jgi:acetyltransferase-like isoleucine patch superfamily enzyme
MVADNTYIGSQSIIAPGVSVGERVVVGANSFVNRSVDDGSIVAGSPARLIGRVEGRGVNVRFVYDD